VFRDPSECEEQKVTGVAKYWSDAEIRFEVWKTMNALAELELRENAQHIAAKAKAKDQSALFALFRQTMSQEVADIHRIQNEMHHTHSAAYQQLVDQIINITHTLRAHADEGTAGISARISAYNKTEASNHQRVLSMIMVKMNDINRQVEELYTESITTVNATQAYAHKVEEGMLAGDARLNILLSDLKNDAQSLEGKDAGDWGAFYAALTAAEQKQLADNLALSSKIETDVGALRGESSAALAAEHLDIRSQLADAFRMVHARLGTVTDTASTRQNVLQLNVSDINAAQAANNEQQEAAMATLRRNFERDRNVAFGRLDAADVGINAAFVSLAASHRRLAAEAAADLAFLQATIDEGVATRNEEAAAVRAWARGETGQVNKSLTHTQALLDTERTRLQHQRDQDLTKMSAKADSDVAAWDSSFNARMDTELRVTHDLLSNRMSEAQEALTLAEGRLSSRSAALQQQFDGLKTLQNSNNGLQQRAIDDLERDAKLEHDLSIARAAALRGNISQMAARLLSIKGEVVGTFDTHRAEVRARIVSDFDSAKERLESQLSRQHTALWNKLNNGTSALVNNLDRLHAVIFDRETALLDFDNAINADEATFKSDSRLEMDGIDRTQGKDRRDMDSRVSQLLDALAAAKARLDSELARVALEERTDDEKMRYKVDDNNNATGTSLDAKGDGTLVLLHRETHAVLQALTAQLDALKRKENADHTELMGTLSAWQNQQESENRRQKKWLQDIKQSCSGTATGIGKKIASLREALTKADHTLTAKGEALEVEQQKKASGMDKSLHLDIANLRKDELVVIASTKTGVLHAIAESATKMNLHLDALNSSAIATKNEVDSATEAMRRTIEARSAARTSEMQSIRVKAAQDKSEFDASISTVLEHIEADKRWVPKELAKSAAAQVVHSGTVKDYIRDSIAMSMHNSSDAKEQAEKTLGMLISAASAEWMQQLEEARQASQREAEKVSAEWTSLSTREVEHKELMTARIASLVEAVEGNQDAMDLALATLRSGMTQVQRNLNETDRVQQQAQLEDTARLRSQIREGLDALRVNASIAMSALRSATDATIESKAKELENQRLVIGKDLLARETLLTTQIANVSKEQEALSVSQQTKIQQFKAAQTQVTMELDILSSTLGAAERLANQKLTLRQLGDTQGVNQQMRDLASKLSRAQSELNVLTLDTSTGEQRAMQEAKSGLGQAKSTLQNMHLALDADQKSDAAVLKGEVATGIGAMEASVVAAIQAAAQKIKSALDLQLSGLDTKVSSATQKMADATNDLTGKMSGLEAAEDQHTAAQDRQILGMTEMLTRLNQEVALSGGQLRANASIVQSLMRKGLEALSAANDQDKARLLALLPRAISAAQTSLADTIASNVIDLRAAVRDRLRAAEAASAAERESTEAQVQLMRSDLERLTRGDMTFDAKWTGSVASIQDELLSLRDRADRNVTLLRTALSESEQAVARDQLPLFGPQARAVAQSSFAARQEALHGTILRNFSGELAAEVTRVQQELQFAEERFNGLAGPAFVGSTARQVDDRTLMQELAKTIANMYKTRDQQIASANGSMALYQDSFETRMARLKQSVTEAMDNSDNVRLRAEQRMNRINDRLSGVLAAANTLDNLRSKIEAVSTTTTTVNTQTSSDYGAIGVNTGKIKGDIAAWRLRLQVFFLFLLCHSKMPSSTSHHHRYCFAFAYLCRASAPSVRVFAQHSVFSVCGATTLQCYHTCTRQFFWFNLLLLIPVLTHSYTPKRLTIPPFLSAHPPFPPTLALSLPPASPYLLSLAFSRVISFYLVRTLSLSLSLLLSILLSLLLSWSLSSRARSLFPPLFLSLASWLALALSLSRSLALTSLARALSLARTLSRLLTHPLRT
jgi:hypothetical protein